MEWWNDVHTYPIYLFKLKKKNDVHRSYALQLVFVVIYINFFFFLCLYIPPVMKTYSVKFKSDIMLYDMKYVVILELSLKINKRKRVNICLLLILWIKYLYNPPSLSFVYNNNFTTVFTIILNFKYQINIKLTLKVK